MLAAVQRIDFRALPRAMNAQRVGVSRIRVADFAFLQIRKQVKGLSKERDFTILQCSAKCSIDPGKIAAWKLVFLPD